MKKYFILLISLFALSCASEKPQSLSDNCLEVLGPLEVLDTTRHGLKNYASKFGNMKWSDESLSSKFDRAAVAIIQLVVSSQEYQTI